MLKPGRIYMADLLVNCLSRRGVHGSHVMKNDERGIHCRLSTPLCYLFSGGIDLIAAENSA